LGCFVAGFLLYPTAVHRQIGCLEVDDTGWVTCRMNRLLDQLKQGLRRIGRGRLEVPHGVPTDSPVNDRGHDTRLRTELDDAHSSLEKRLTPTTPPAGPPSGRTRKAILSKARRTARTQSALSFWGLAPVASADESGHPATLAPASMLAGSSLLQPSTAAAGARRDRPLGLLGAAIPFGERQEVAAPQALLEPAPPLWREDDATDRPA
jgi:hypothetical protein